MKKFGCRILEVFSWLLLLGAIALVLQVTTQIRDKGYVTIGGYSTFRVVTGSMEPTIMTGALLVCEDEDIQDIKVNDIICFESASQSMKGAIITHRVIEIKDVHGVTRLTTRGDANSVEDGLYVTEDNLIGRVVWYSGSQNVFAKALSFMNGSVGFLSCIVFPVLIVCIFVMRESMVSINREMAELRRLEAQGSLRQVVIDETEEEMIERLKKEIYQELNLEPEETEEEMIARLREELRAELEAELMGNVPEESEEEMRARIRAELREELGLSDEGESPAE